MSHIGGALGIKGFTLVEAMLAVALSGVVLLGVTQVSNMSFRLGGLSVQKSSFLSMLSQVQNVLSKKNNCTGNFAGFSFSDTHPLSIPAMYVYNPNGRGPIIQTFNGGSLVGNNNVVNLRATITPVTLLAKGSGYIMARVDISGNSVLARNGGVITSFRPLSGSIWVNLFAKVVGGGTNQVQSCYEPPHCYWKSTSCSSTYCYASCNNTNENAVNGAVQCGGGSVVAVSTSGEKDGQPHAWVASCTKFSHDCPVKCKDIFGSFLCGGDADDCWSNQYANYDPDPPQVVQVYCCAG